MTKYYTEEQVQEAMHQACLSVQKGMVFCESILATLTPIDTLTPIELPDAPQFTEDELELLSEAFEDCFKSGYYTELRAKLQPPRTPWTAKDFLGYLAEVGMEGVEVRVKNDNQWCDLFRIEKDCIDVIWINPNQEVDQMSPKFELITHIRHKDPQGEWVETECRREQR